MELDYFVIKKIHNDTVLERIPEKIFSKFNKDEFIYWTIDSQDEELLSICEKESITEIIWRRYFDKNYRNYHKIFVTFYPGELFRMNTESELKIFELKEKIEQEVSQIKIKKEIKYNAELKNHREKVFENNKEFENLEDENEILEKWKSLGFCFPPPDKIKKIKEIQNVSWRKFINNLKK